eukprot:TRINITY_DN2970_c0_g1_i2.p1 TRINITY_DN2970_c0_g1~~TRINITY_DN2970_c0_g1_i2.p1  ORF type:complete len:229 (-),score=40.41 TRINITY_DN2970_c0_g1_i2:178-864(-)
MGVAKKPIIFLILGLGVVGFGIASILFPFYTETRVSSLAPDCIVTDTKTFDVATRQCSSGCGFFSVICGLSNGTSSNNWQNNCTKDYCNRQAGIWNGTRGLLGSSIAVFFVSQILYAIYGFSRKLSAGWVIGTTMLAMLVGGGALIIFAVGLPISIRGDTNEKNNDPPETACATQGPCSSFFGEETSNSITHKWSADIGWYLNCGYVGAVLLWMALMVIFGQVKKGSC